MRYPLKLDDLHNTVHDTVNLMNCVMIYPYSDPRIVDWFLQLVVKLVSIRC